MTTVADLTRWLDQFVDFSTAESWDNVGLLFGSSKTEVQRVMTCLTVTSKTADEAIASRTDLIVSHHPVLFRATKRLSAESHESGFLWDLARAGIAIVSPHTAFDNCRGGINDGLAARLKLEAVKPLRLFAPRPMFKVVVFVTESDWEKVAKGAFEAGAGRIGNYDECSFSTSGEGTFRPNELANPAIGASGIWEKVIERRFEVVCPGNRLDAVLVAIRSSHSYEEPAIDVYPLHPNPRGNGLGAGRIGRLPLECSLEVFANEVARVLNVPSLQYVGDLSRSVRRVAIVCGAGDDFLPDAAKQGADVLLTGEARFHRGLEAESLGIGLLAAGHHATERPGMEDLAIAIGKDHPDLTVWASAVERDPFRPVSTQPGLAEVRNR